MEWISNILTGHRPRKRGGKTSSSFHRDKDNEKEKGEEKPTEKQEEKVQGNDKTESQTMKSNPVSEEKREDVKDGLKPLEVKDVDGDTIRPTPTPPNTETNEGGSDTFRGRVPWWNDSSYQEPDAGNESDSNSFDIEEEGMEI